MYYTGISFNRTLSKLEHNLLMSDSDKETNVLPITQTTAIESTPSTVSHVSEADLPKLVMCFDISTLSLQELKTIASDLKVSSYNSMTKEQLCKVLQAL